MTDRPQGPNMPPRVANAVLAVGAVALIGAVLFMVKIGHMDGRATVIAVFGLLACLFADCDSADRQQNQQGRF